MLKKKNRLTSNYEFNKVYRRGEKVRSPSFDLFYLKENTKDSKIGFVVSNKFSKVAPKRNRVKRVFREIVKNSLDKFEDGFWIIIKPKPLSLEKSYEEISKEFNKVLSKIFVSH